MVMRARAIVMTCFFDELSSLLHRQGLSLGHIDGEVLACYARTKFDAEKYSPRFERR